MSDQSQDAAENVAQVIASEAAAIVAEGNAEAERAETINREMINALMQSHEARFREEFMRSIDERFIHLRGEQAVLIERLAQCETRQAATAETAEAAAMASAVVLGTSLNPEPLKPQGDAEADRAEAEKIRPEILEAEPEKETKAPPAPRRRTRFL